MDFLIINKKGGTASFPIKILNTREYFGRKETQIQPIGGSGKFWVIDAHIVPGERFESTRILMGEANNAK